MSEGAYGRWLLAKPTRRHDALAFARISSRNPAPKRAFATGQIEAKKR